MADKFGHSFMMLFGQAARGILFFILAFFVYTDAPFWLFVLFLMLNTAVGVAFQVGSDTYLFSITELRERPSYYSKIRVGFNVGWALGPMLGAFFSKTPFWLFFIMTGILCIAGTIYTEFACCRNNVVKNNTEKKKIESTTEKINIRTILSNHRFCLLVIGTFFLMLLASQLYSTLSIYSTKTAGISSKELGMIYSLNGFIAMTLQIPLIAILAKIKVSFSRQLAIGTLLYAVGYFQLGFITNVFLIAAAVAIITCGEIIVQPALYTAVSKHTQSESAGRMFSINTLMRGIGYAIGPWIGGQLFSGCSSVVLWSILSLFALIALISFHYGCMEKNK
jgi:MFS family permease